MQMDNDDIFKESLQEEEMFSFYPATHIRKVVVKCLWEEMNHKHCITTSGIQRGFILIKQLC